MAEIQKINKEKSTVSSIEQIIPMSVFKDSVVKCHVKRDRRTIEEIQEDLKRQKNTNGIQ